MNTKTAEAQSWAFLTNLNADLAWAVQRAAQETEFKVKVEEQAKTQPGDLLPGFVSVWTAEPTNRDHGPFWKRYDELVNPWKLKFIKETKA